MLGHQGEMYNTVSVPLSDWFVLVEVYYAFRAMFPIWLAELGLLLDLVLGLVVVEIRIQLLVVAVPRGGSWKRFVCSRQLWGVVWMLLCLHNTASNEAGQSGIYCQEVQSRMLYRISFSALNTTANSRN